MANVHPLLADLLAKRGAMSPEAYDTERLRILRDEIGIGEAAPIGPAPIAPKSKIELTIKDHRGDAKRIRDEIEAARSKGRFSVLTVAAAPPPPPVARSVETTIDGETVRRLLSKEEVAKAYSAQMAKAAAEAPLASAYAAPLDIPVGFELRGGVVRPIERKPPGPDPIVAAVRKRWSAGEFGPPGKACGRPANVTGAGGCAGEKCPDCSPAVKASRAEIVRLRAEVEFREGSNVHSPFTGARVACKVCHGTPDKVIGKLCPCGGKGYISVDLDASRERADRGAVCADPLPENTDSITYTAYLTGGGCTTIHADNGMKAVRGACQSLRAAANGFSKVTFDSGVLLVLHDYETGCPACYGKGVSRDGRTCTQCVEGRFAKRGARFYFGDQCAACRGGGLNVKGDAGCDTCGGSGADPVPAEDRAHAAGLRAMSGWDPERSCGRKKCKALSGGTCHACEDAKAGGYQRPGYIRCADCKGTGKIQGAEHEKCRGKGYFNTTEFFWINQDPDPCPKCQPRGEINPDCNDCQGHGFLAGFAVTNEIRRVDLLAEDQAPKRDRNIVIKIGGDLVEVGAGAIPSRKSGAVMHLTGTAREKYQTANKVYGKQDIVKGRDGRSAWSNRANQGVGFRTSVHNDRSTFSKG